MAIVALRAKADKIILGGMGLTNDDYLFFRNIFENAGSASHIISFVNTNEDPPLERLLVPDMALTAAEYFAVEKHQKVLVLLTDMTLYAEALSIVSNRMDQIRRKTVCPVHFTATWPASMKKQYNSPMAVQSRSLQLPRCLEAISHTPSRQHWLHHRGTTIYPERYRYWEGYYRPLPQLVAFKTTGHRKENPGRPPAGHECGSPAFCRCHECQNKTRKRI
jgi:hypothetical protein